jgi:hypothetical protein
MAFEALSQPELLVCSAIGIYALAKMFALISTMALVIENSHGSNRAPRSAEKKPASEPTKPVKSSDAKGEDDKAYLVKPEKK